MICVAGRLPLQLIPLNDYILRRVQLRLHICYLPTDVRLRRSIRSITIEILKDCFQNLHMMHGPFNIRIFQNPFGLIDTAILKFYQLHTHK